MPIYYINLKYHTFQFFFFLRRKNVITSKGLKVLCRTDFRLMSTNSETLNKYQKLRKLYPSFLELQKKFTKCPIGRG